MAKSESTTKNLHGPIPTLFQSPKRIETKAALESERGELHLEAMRLGIEQKRLEVYRDELNRKTADLMRYKNTLDRVASQLSAWENNLDRRRKAVDAASALLEGNENQSTTENTPPKSMSKL